LKDCANTQLEVAACNSRRTALNLALFGARCQIAQVESSMERWPQRETLCIAAFAQQHQRVRSEISQCPNCQRFFAKVVCYVGDGGAVSRLRLHAESRWIETARKRTVSSLRRPWRVWHDQHVRNKSPAGLRVLHFAAGVCAAKESPLPPPSPASRHSPWDERSAGGRRKEPERHGGPRSKAVQP
jgi:hypothetical protein